MARNAVAFEVPNQDSLRAQPPGAFAFMLNQQGQRMGIVHNCPCGCGLWSAMWFTPLSDAGGLEWDVQGEWPKVTMSPSIGIGRQPNGGFHWHGYLRNGVFEEC